MGNRNVAAEQRWEEGRPAGFTDEEWEARCFGPPASDNGQANRSPPVGTRVATRTDPKQGQECSDVFRFLPLPFAR